MSNAALGMTMLCLIVVVIMMGFPTVAQAAMVPSYYLDDYVRQAKRWSVKKLEGCLLILADTDRAMATNRACPKYVQGLWGAKK